MPDLFDQVHTEAHQGADLFDQVHAESQPKGPASLDWSHLVSNLPNSALRFIQGTAPGPTSQSPDVKPGGRFSQAHPDVADKHPMIASAADSLEELVHNVTHPSEFFEKDPVGAANTYGNLARGGFNLGARAAAGTADAVRSVASSVSPDALRTAGDVAGLVSPRAAHAINLLNKIRGAVSRETPAATAPPAAAPGPRIVPGEAPPPARSDFRQGIVDELNQPAATPVSEPAVQSPPSSPTSPGATPPVEVAPPASPSPKVPEAPPAGPSGGGNPFEGAARTKRATVLARFLYSNGEGITHADALRMSPDHWKLAWKGAEQLGGEGIDFSRAPSLKTQREALKQLRDWEDAAAAPVEK